MTLTYVQKVSEGQDSKKTFSLYRCLTSAFETIILSERECWLVTLCWVDFSSKYLPFGAYFCQSGHFQHCLMFIPRPTSKGSGTVVFALPIRIDSLWTGGPVDHLYAGRSSLEHLPGWVYPHQCHRMSAIPLVREVLLAATQTVLLRARLRSTSPRGEWVQWHCIAQPGCLLTPKGFNFQTTSFIQPVPAKRRPAYFSINWTCWLMSDLVD